VREAPVFAQVRRFTRKRTTPAAPPVPGTPEAAPRTVEGRPRVRGRELTTFHIVMLLIVTAVVVTAYISNIVKVDALTADYTGLEREEARLVQTRENLRAEINMLSSYSRVQEIATARLHLVHAPQQPVALVVPGIEATDGEKR
jgi:cell division protein FtsL